MAIPKSPFIIHQQFISPKLCENIVSDLDFYQPDVDSNDNPIKMIRHHLGIEEILYDNIQQIIPEAFDHYNSKYKGTEHIEFEYMAEGTLSVPCCDNSQYIASKWVRTKNRDFTGILFLSEYSDDAPFDSEYEVYGGKLEFPQHGFGFNPERGTLIIFPSGPHFLYANTPIITGDLLQVKFHFAATSPYLHQPNDFPGDYRSWFAYMSN
jgi:hypothetical protein